jgi:hypothetical protein
MLDRVSVGHMAMARIVNGGMGRHGIVHWIENLVPVSFMCSSIRVLENLSDISALTKCHR